MKKLMFLWMLLLGSTLYAAAQKGAITGTVTDEINEPVIGAMVIVKQGLIEKGGTVTDFDGKYMIKPLDAGRYNLTVEYSGYKKNLTAGVIVSPGKTTKVDVKLKLNPHKLEEVVVTSYKIPLVDKYSPGSTKSITSEEIEKLPTRNTMSMASIAPGKRGWRKNKSNVLLQARVENESYKKENENDFRNVRANPLSTMSIDVDRASYSNVRRFINDGQMPPADAVRIEEMVNYFEYNYPQPEGDAPLNIVTELTDCPWQPKHKLLHIGMQARSLNTEQLPPSNLVFLVDVSGSMDVENKLPLAVSALKMLTQKLRAEDKIAIVVYAGSAGLVLPPTSGADKETIYAALDRLEAGGSTAGGEGIKLAYKIAGENYIRNGNNRVILATDGDFNVGVSGDNEMERLITEEKKKGVYLTCLGFGMGNYKDSKMEVLADKGNGNYAYIDNEKEAEKTLVKEFGGTVFTLAKDVKTQIEFNPQFVQSYRLVGYENRLLNTEDFKDDKKDAGDMGSGHSVTIIYEIIPAGVASKSLRNTDPLKYQVNNVTGSAEFATIRFRYKKPNGNNSKEMVHIVANKTSAIQKANADIRFATSVAMFGMLLKNSQYKGSSNYATVIALAKTGIGEDKNGYRSEYIQLVNRVNKDHNKGKDDPLVGWYDEE